MELTANGDVWVVGHHSLAVHYMLVQHGLERVQAWEHGRGYEVKVVEKWNENGNYDRLLPFSWIGLATRFLV